MDELAENEVRAKELTYLLGEDYDKLSEDRAEQFRALAFTLTERMRAERKEVLLYFAGNLEGYTQSPDDKDLVPGFLAAAASIRTAVQQSENFEDLGQFELTADDFQPDPLGAARPGEPFHASHDEVCGNIESLLEEVCELPPHPATWWHASGDEDGNIFALWSDSELFYADPEEEDHES